MKLTNQIQTNFNYVQSCLSQYETSKQPLMSDAEKQILINQKQELEILKGELESFSHEKVVLDVLTRPLVQNIHLQKQLRNMKNGPKIPFMNSHNHTFNTNTTTVDKPILIPEYIPLHQRQSKLLNRSNNNNNHLPTPLVRNTRGSTVVPNIKLADELPEALQHIKSKPIQSISQQMSKKSMKSKKKKVIVQRNNPMEIDPLTLQQLQQQYEMTQLELQTLGKQLTNTKQK